MDHHVDRNGNRQSRTSGSHVGVRASWVLAALALVAGAHRSSLRADAGDLDPGFGTQGKVVTDFGDEESASDLAVGPRGIIVVAGASGPFFSRDMILVRYDVRGGLDTGFGDGGKVITDLGNDESAVDVAFQEDGKILVLGERTVFSDENEFVSREVNLVRHLPGGALDDDFGDGGIVTVSDFDSAAAVAVTRKGKIIVGGSARIDAQNDFSLRRYESDGSPDGSFGEGGMAILDLGPADQVVSLAVQHDGKTVIAGDFAAELEDEGRNFLVARFDGEGALDTSFGDEGLITTHFNEFDDVAAVAIAKNGKIVVAGTSAEFDGPDQAVLFRYHRDGSPDLTFGVGGVAGGLVGADVGQHESVFGMALQKDGKIVVAGEILTDESSELVVARFARNGDLDPRFAEEGLAVADSSKRGVAIQRNGRIIAAGSVGGDITLAGYLAR